MASTRSYYADKSLSAAFYDTVTAADRRLEGDLAVYASLAPSGGSILELGVGTGRLAFALADQGFAVTGIDIAPAMLAQASTRLATLPLEVTARVALKRGDLTALDLKRTFDLVICPYFTLAHLPRGMAWTNAFATMGRHLQPGGLAAVHLPRESVMRSPGPAQADLPVLAEPTATGGRLLLYVRERSFREALGRLDQVIEYVELDARGQVVRRSPERLTYYMTDPTPHAAPAGLAAERDPIAIGEVGDIYIFRKA